MGGLGKSHFILPLPFRWQGKKKKKKRFCHWIPAKGHARVKVPSSHTPRVIKKCDFGEKKKGKRNEAE